jgi:drug/metabolite transporter (DMT)-like permease
MIRALTVSPAATVVPFSYTNLVWATLYGYILFDEVPSTHTMVGAAIIVASGLYIFHREQLRKS